MNIRDLHYFVTAAQGLHFARAADLCHVSQSTLSIQIKKMEETLGVALFERSGKSVMLTGIGTQMLPKARAVLDGVAVMKELARSSQDPLSGTLQLGAFPSLAPYFFPLILSAVAMALPQLSLVLVEEKTEMLTQMLLEGELGAAVIALPVLESKCTVIPLFEEPFLLAVPAAHPFAVRKQVWLEELSHEHVLLLDEGHCLRAQALEICSMIGVGESSSYRATSLETLRSMVASGAGVTFMPRLAVRESDTLVRYIPFAAPQPSRHLGLVYRSSDPRHVLYARLAEVMRSVFGTYQYNVKSNMVE